jgi:hypothetical protein
MTRRFQIVVSQIAGEVVNRLNDLSADGWKLQSYDCFPCSYKGAEAVKVPTWCILLYKENNNE